MRPIADSADLKRASLYQRYLLRRLRRIANKQGAEPLSEEDWGAVWKMHSDPASLSFHALLARLPKGPRCAVCGAPFAGIGGRMIRPLGYRPSRKNPEICDVCVELSPPGGMKMPTGVLFADLRGFTARSERADPGAVSAELRDFYATAERVLFPEAVIDKLIGDEVMALYLPSALPPRHGRSVAELMVEHAGALMEALGYSDGQPSVEVGIGLDFGEAFVGNIGGRARYDFTAVGDVVNTASRLQTAAGPGEVVLSSRVAAGLVDPPGQPVELALKGKESKEAAYRWRVADSRP
jgi:adenylate cyclase